MDESTALPLQGIRVVEFAHMVMGPTCGMVLADLGAEVIKVEPPGGDKTRRLPGPGAGFFTLFNRNKKSLTLDLKSEDGLAAAKRLVATADIVTENFRPGAMSEMGLDYASLAASNPRLIYVSHKGFLPGPYGHRTALDEVVQMMGGLAYMTGRPGDPLRAGASVNDIMGGMFGAIGALAALRERERTGAGQEIQAGLFENNVFLVAQHMMQLAVTGSPALPLPQRLSAWAIYDLFEVGAGKKMFLAVVSDVQWRRFCQAFALPALLADARLRSNGERVQQRSWMMPALRSRLASMSVAEVTAACEKAGLPYAPINRPEDLFDDPHLSASGGFGEVELPAGGRSQMPLLPISLGGKRLPIRSQPPAVGRDTQEILASLGLARSDVDITREPG